MEPINQVLHYFSNLFSTDGFPPRWYCGQWDSFTGWFYILSDLGIWAAYYTIPLLLVYFVRKRKDIPFQRVFVLFAAFILACGSTHLLDALMFWWPAYRFSGLVYFWTAIVSWVTIFALVPVIPKALSLKSPTELQREIDERKRAEMALRNSEAQLKEYTKQLETTNKELESFSYSVSHDLRTPLRSIEGFSRIILEEHAHQLDAEGRKYFQYVMENSHRMSELIEALLGISRISRSELQIREVDLSEMVNHLARTLQEQEPERTVEFKVMEDVRAKGDARLLQTALQNLLDNAWKFTSKREDARIEFGALAKGGAIVYYVKDNGAGFNMNYVDKLFGAFQRLHKADDYPGSGIGLATVQRIIQRHQGTIWAEGTVGEGATFYFTLNPVLVRKDLMSDAPEQPLKSFDEYQYAAVHVPVAENKVILLVEDSPFDEQLTIKAIDESGFTNRIVVARDGEEAMDYLFATGAYASRSKADDPVLILLDLKIPKVDGFELLTRIRLNDRTRHIPVVVLSSSNRKEDVVRSVNSGANRFIHKHADSTQLISLLKAFQAKPSVAECQPSSL